MKIKKVQAISCTCKKTLSKIPPYVQADPVGINHHLLFPPPNLQATYIAAAH